MTNIEEICKYYEDKEKKVVEEEIEKTFNDYLAYCDCDNIYNAITEIKDFPAQNTDNIKKKEATYDDFNQQDDKPELYK